MLALRLKSEDIKQIDVRRESTNPFYVLDAKAGAWKGFGFSARKGAGKG